MGALDEVFEAIGDAIPKVFSDTPITLTRREQGYNLATRTESATVTTKSVIASPPVPFETRRVDGENILATDTVVFVSAQELGSFDPEPDTGVTISAEVKGRKLAVPSATLYGADTDAAWEIQLRG